MKKKPIKHQRKRRTRLEMVQNIPDFIDRIIRQKQGYNEFKRSVSTDYDITERHAENIWNEIRKLLKDRYEQEHNEILNEHLQRYFDLLADARSRGQTRVQREILNDLSKIYGLEQRNIDITSAGEQININIVLSDD